MAGYPKWLVWNGKSQAEKDDDWGHPILGNLHMIGMGFNGINGLVKPSRKWNGQVGSS